MQYFAIFCIVMTSVITQSVGVSLEKDLSMTLSQKQTLDKFREQVKPLLKTDLQKSDIYLIRWLRARNFDINRAEVMLKQNLKWRQERKMDTINNEDFRDMIKEYPTAVGSYDKQNRPIAFIDMMEWDIREGVVSGKIPKILRYLDWRMENLTNQVFERQQKGMNVTQWLILANAENFNMINQGCPICIPAWIQFLASLENNYPGWMDELIIIDTTQAAFTILEILKPALSKSTRDSLKIFNSNKNQWQKYLDERVSRSERYAAYGGTKPSNQRDY